MPVESFNSMIAPLTYLGVIPQCDYIAMREALHIIETVLDNYFRMMNCIVGKHFCQLMNTC